MALAQTSHGAVPVGGAHGFQHPHSRRGATLKALTDVVGVGPGPILKQHLSGFAGPGQRLQKVLHLISGATTAKREQGHLQKNRLKYKEIPALPRCLNTGDAKRVGSWLLSFVYSLVSCLQPK